MSSSWTQKLQWLFDLSALFKEFPDHTLDDVIDSFPLCIKATLRRYGLGQYTHPLDLFYAVHYLDLSTIPPKILEEFEELKDLYVDLSDLPLHGITNCFINFVKIVKNEKMENWCYASVCKCEVDLLKYFHEVKKLQLGTEVGPEAIKQKDKKCIDYLVEKGNIQLGHHLTYCASLNGDWDMFTYFLQKGCPYTYNTTLHHAKKHDKLDMVTDLLKNYEKFASECKQDQ